MQETRRPAMNWLKAVVWMIGVPFVALLLFLFLWAFGFFHIQVIPVPL